MTDWLSAIGILLSGLVIGSLFVYRSRNKQPGSAGDAGGRRDLEARRDALIAQLRALDEGETDARARLESEAASVLRALDESPPASDRVSQSAPAGRPPSALAGFLWGSGTAAAIAVLIWYVMQSPGPQSIAAAQAPLHEAPLAQLEAAALNNPDDIDARIDLAKACLDRRDLVGVFEQTKAVLAKNPNEPRALTYQAIVRMAMGQRDVARKLLDSATTNDPKLTEAWITLAWLRTQDSDGSGAAKAIEEAIRQHPEDEQRLRTVLAQMQSPGAAPASTHDPVK
jgi:tetratricopeptide (TPR) repeat protein